MAREFEIGVQLHLPTFRHLSLPEFVRLGRMAHAGGISQFWVTDNLQSRNPFVVLAALAQSAPLKLGTAVTVQYFRNPVDVADSVAALTELMDGREFGLGLARGNRRTPRFVKVVKPISMLRETAESVRLLLAGQEVRFADYPTVASYFNLVPDAPFKLNFLPKVPGIALLWRQRAAGARRGRRVHGRHHLWRNVPVRGARGIHGGLAPDCGGCGSRGGPKPALRKVAEIKLSVSKDARAAREFTKPSVASRMIGLQEGGYGDCDFHKLGIAPANQNRLQQAENAGGSGGDYLDLVTDAMIDAIFVAGDPAGCREKMTEVCAIARSHGFQQLMFSEFGPDLEQGLKLLCDEILPGL